MYKMSSSTPTNSFQENKEAKRSQSYPGTPRSMNSKVSVNLNSIFSDMEDDATITPTEEPTAYQTAYQTALEQTELEAAGFSSLLTGNTRSINDMETLRSQIHSALNPRSTEVSPSGFSDTSSVDTMVLLRSALPQSSPELQLDDNGVLLASMNSLKSLYPTRSPANNILDSSLVAENTILKENIGRERLRRKHCEEQIQNLQHKLLECQEESAVMVSTDRKRQIMIEQLDRTLATIVDGWKKKEATHIAEIIRLKEQNEALESAKERQEELLSNFEAELATAVDTITEEQSKVKQLDQRYQKQINDYENKLSASENENEQLKQQNLAFEEKKHEILEEKERCLNENVQSLTDMENQVHQLKEINSKLEEKMKVEENEFKTTFNQLEKHVHAVEEEKEMLALQLDNSTNQVKIMHTTIEELTKEKETLSMEVSLLNSKFEAVKTKQDSEMRLQLESEFNDQIHEIQRQISITETELRSSQKKQISELMKRHKEEIERYRKLYQQELKKKDDQILKIRTDHEKDLQTAKEQISSLNATGQHLERQRSELMNRMKMMMQQHWDETVLLLGNGANNKQMPRIDAQPAFEPFSSTFQQTSFQHPSYRPNAPHIPPQMPFSQYTNPVYPGYPVNTQSVYRSNGMSQQTQYLNYQEEPTRPRTSSPVSFNSSNVPPATVSSQSFVESPRKHTAPSVPFALKSPPKDEHAVSLLYQDLDDVDDDDECERPGNKFIRGMKQNETDPLAVSMDTSSKSDKDVQLTHFIEKLLQRSPGQPLDEVPVRDVSEERVRESITAEVDHLLQTESGLQTPKKQSIKPKTAFKKSVVRDSNKVQKNEPREVLEHSLSHSNLSEKQILHLLKNLLDKKKLENSSMVDDIGGLPSSESVNKRTKVTRDKFVKNSELKTTSAAKKSTKSVRGSSESNGYLPREHQKMKPTSHRSISAWK